MLCDASRRENGRRRRGDLDGKRALNAVELAHAQGRTRDGERGRESKAVQRRDERHEEAMRTEAEDWLMHIHLIVGVTVVNTHGGLFYT